MDQITEKVGGTGGGGGVKQKNQDQTTDFDALIDGLKKW